MLTAGAGVWAMRSSGSPREAAAPVPAGVRARLTRAAANAARALAGRAGASPVAWDATRGRWDLQTATPHAADVSKLPKWWQSALALRSLVNYLQATGNRQAFYQHVIDTTYASNVSLPGTPEPHSFANNFMDDTAWWGMAWAAAARYELTVRHDSADAAKYLAAAEYDAAYIAAQPTRCGGGIEFKVGYPPNTITNAEFASLAAQLAQIRATPGVFLDPGRARAWLAAARRTLGWLTSSGLVHPASGRVAVEDTGTCHVSGTGLTYMQGEMADALVQMGRATSEPAYFTQAEGYLNRVLRPQSGMLAGGVFQEPCEARPGRCSGHSFNATAFKGVLDDAVFDWRQATGSVTYDRLLLAQGAAVLAHSASDGTRLTTCATATGCRLGFYWARRVAPLTAPIPANPGSQASGLAALTSALVISAETGRPGSAEMSRTCPRRPPSSPGSGGCGCRRDRGSRRQCRTGAPLAPRRTRRRGP